MCGQNHKILKIIMKKPFRVAVCVDATKTLGRAAFQGVVGYIRKTDCEWILHSSAGNRLWLPTEADSLPINELDGIISFASNESTIKKVEKAGVHLVSIFDDPPDSSIPAVLSDNDAIGRLAARHLVELQLKNFVYYGTDLVNNSEARFRGFAAFLVEKNTGAPACPTSPPARADSGRPGSLARGSQAGGPAHIKVGVEDVMRSSSDDRRNYLRRLGKELLLITHDGRDALGVFAYSDNMGVTVIEACREVGLAVPGKVAVIAVATDEIICELSVPPLTTILQDARKIGQESAAMLDVLIRGRVPKNRRIIVPPLGISVRTSTDIVATEDPYVIKAVRVIRERFRDKLNVEDICEALKISRRVFEERFRCALGRSPYEEIMRTRIRHAETLLVQTSDTNLTISLESGFASERRFDENFRKIIGMSPGEYRRKFAGLA